MDVLLQEAENNGISLNGNPDPTAADVAVQVSLQDKELLERKHAEQYLIKPRSFEYFQTASKKIPEFKQPTAKTLAALEKDLDDWFEKKKRGRESRVFVYPKTDAVWFLVRHGDPLRREGSLDGGQTSSVFYRPEKYDVLVYEPTIGEIRMHACGKGEKDLFRRQFGRHVSNNEDFFPETGKYTLEPLRNGGDTSIVCTDVDGMEWGRLRKGDRDTQDQRRVRRLRRTRPRHAPEGSDHPGELSSEVHGFENGPDRDHPTLEYRAVYQGQ
jgi:hypothetical protein